MREVTRRVHVRESYVSDAHLVALLQQYAVITLYSADTDFRKFGWLAVKNPLE